MRATVSDRNPDEHRSGPNLPHRGFGPLRFLMLLARVGPVTNLLGEPAETLLPAEPGADLFADGLDAEDVALQESAATLAWALLAEDALTKGRDLEGYAFARTAYHRSLDVLRREGWRGHGPVPWAHKPNRGFLRALAALATASERLRDIEEAHRCREFLRESSLEAYEELVS